MKLKKSFGILILLFLLIGFLAPEITSSTSTTLCCKITRSFKYKGDTYSSGNCVGEVNGSTHCYRPDGKELCTSITYVRDNWGTICLFNAIYGITDIVFNILLALAVLFGLGGGYLVLSAGGDPEKINKGKDLIVYAILGVVASFFARIIPSLLSIIMG